MKRLCLLKGGLPLIGCVEIAESLADRVKGLLGRSCLGPDHALHIVPCGSIHTFGMQFALDVFFLSEDLEVVRIVRNVMPGRLAVGGFRACSTLELEAGWLSPDALKVGDRVEFAEAQGHQIIGNGSSSPSPSAQ